MPCELIVGNDPHEMERPASPFGPVHGLEKDLVRKEAPVLDGLVDPDPVEENPAARPEMEMAGFGIPDRSGRHADGFARGLEEAWGNRLQRASKCGVRAWAMRFPASAVPDPPAVENDEKDVGLAFANRDRRRKKAPAGHLGGGRDPQEVQDGRRDIGQFAPVSQSEGRKGRARKNRRG